MKGIGVSEGEAKTAGDVKAEGAAVAAEVSREVDQPRERSGRVYIGTPEGRVEVDADDLRPRVKIAAEQDLAGIGGRINRLLHAGYNIDIQRRRLGETGVCVRISKRTETVYKTVEVAAKTIGGAFDGVVAEAISLE